MIRKIRLALGFLGLVVGLAVVAGAEQSVPAEATQAVAQAAASLSSPDAAAGVDAFLASLAADQPTLLAACPAGTCNRNLDCFQQQYTCDFGSVKHCFGGPTTGCQGECGCW